MRFGKLAKRTTPAAATEKGHCRAQQIKGHSGRKRHEGPWWSWAERHQKDSGKAAQTAWADFRARPPRLERNFHRRSANRPPNSSGNFRFASTQPGAGHRRAVAHASKITFQHHAARGTSTGGHARHGVAPFSARARFKLSGPVVENKQLAQFPCHQQQLNPPQH